MELNFDIRRNLKPYKRIELGYEEFSEFFVDSFEKDSRRHQIFEHYKRYIEDFQEKAKTDFKQWIDGSFVTNKKNPVDIDFVNLVDYEIVEEKESLIRGEFKPMAEKTYSAPKGNNSLNFFSSCSLIRLFSITSPGRFVGRVLVCVKLNLRLIGKTSLFLQSPIFCHALESFYHQKQKLCAFLAQKTFSPITHFLNL